MLVSKRVLWTLEQERLAPRWLALHIIGSGDNISLYVIHSVHRAHFVGSSQCIAILVLAERKVMASMQRSKDP